MGVNPPVITGSTLADTRVTTPLIVADNVSVTVPYYQPESRRLLTLPKQMLSGLYTNRTKRTHKTILRDISFKLDPGERLGIIGVNGAGKSTLLRALGGVYPTHGGSLHINGDARGLFNINLGMNYEGTGVENIYLRGLQMGLSIADIHDRVEDVVAFSELGEAIHQPLSTYSAGMSLRLAFSVSTMIDPDILLLDEWIGAGDIKFRFKAQERMNQLVDKSRGLVIATHNTALMKTLCSRALLLDGGDLVFDGPIDDALATYEERVAKVPTDTAPEEDA